MTAPARLAVGEDPLEGRLRFLEIGGRAIDPAKARVGVHDDRQQRLVDFVRRSKPKSPPRSSAVRRARDGGHQRRSIRWYNVVISYNNMNRTRLPESAPKNPTRVPADGDRAATGNEIMHISMTKAHINHHQAQIEHRTPSPPEHGDRDDAQERDEPGLHGARPA